MKLLFSANAFAPLRESLFFSLWIAAFISNIGTWMQNVGVGWLVATMSAPLLVISLIQTASSLRRYCSAILPFDFSIPESTIMLAFTCRFLKQKMEDEHYTLQMAFEEQSKWAGIQIKLLWDI